MIASLTGSVIAVLPPRVTKDGKALSDLFILQPGERAPIMAFLDVSPGTLPPPSVGEVITMDAQGWVSRFDGGSLAVKVTDWGSAA